jgi:hypothetical protein
LAASSTFRWVSSATIASSFLRPNFAPRAGYLRTPENIWRAEAPESPHLRQTQISFRIRLLLFATGVIHVLTAVITAPGD